MTKVTIETIYTASSSTHVELPAGKTWNDVTDYYVKWGTLHVQFNGADSWQEYYLSGETETDVKRPDRTTVYATNADGETDYDTVLSE